MSRCAVKNMYEILQASGILGSAATYLPGRHAINSALLAGNGGALALYMTSDDFATGLGMLGTTAGLSSLMGVTLTMAIGGMFFFFVFDVFLSFFVVGHAHMNLTGSEEESKKIESYDFSLPKTEVQPTCAHLFALNLG